MRTKLYIAVAIIVVGGLLSIHTQESKASPTIATAKISRPWSNTGITSLERANLLIKQMTLDEKIAVLHGVHPIPVKGYVGYVPPNARLGIPALKLADGRAGVGNHARDVTLLPAPIAAASSWDVSLMHQFGEVLGTEQWGKGTNVELGPTVNIVRVPEWGRSFESYGEDPYLNARMAVAEIKGIQSKGPIADANMYLTMNQESNRFKENSIVDERTLQEIYLPPFAAAVEEGHVGTIMCAYVKTNDAYSCENRNLLINMLRKQLHFSGWVMSDWGATHSTVPAANNGLDQEMPGDKFFGEALKEAVKDGQVSEATVDEHVRRILVTMFRHGLFDKEQTGNWAANVRSPRHDRFSRTVAEEGTVLLKNAGELLPLSGTETVAVIGAAGGVKPKAEGGGSSGVIPPYVISPRDGIQKRVGASVHVEYADGSSLDDAVRIAKTADVAIVFANTEETEGKDRPNLELPGNQNQLIAAVAAANKRTVVVLDTGGPVLMPWIDAVPAVIEAWYPGQEDGNAIAAVLYGDVDPSAKLPLTFPRTADAIPTSQAEQWPGVDGRSVYSEKLNVGYRWYDATGTQPLFPFGFGLSYTTFKVSHLVVTPSHLLSTQAGEEPKQVEVKVDVTNTGKREGAEVVQVYVADPSANGEPPHQLRGFAKVHLKAGETEPVTLHLDPRSFSVYDTGSKRWTVADGTYGVLAGTSSRDLPLHAKVVIGAASGSESSHK